MTDNPQKTSTPTPPTPTTETEKRPVGRPKKEEAPWEECSLGLSAHCKEFVRPGGFRRVLEIPYESTIDPSNLSGWVSGFASRVEIMMPTLIPSLVVTDADGNRVASDTPPRVVMTVEIFPS